ncbi:hypothetical protein Daus18300_003194 [Diaporthe australafricana]|uniref:Peptidase A1 domain-containing protein n=1 Tax=Diaporthe australafricana TaxID=127596 RepID=A0ABR3XHN0_9PEZI
MADPLSVEATEAWDGVDGSWSTFIVRLGTPEQYFSVLPSTANQQTWVPIPEGCASSLVGNFSDCGDSRGAWPFENKDSDGFQSNQSSTWETIGIYELFIEEHLGMDGNGLFGYDTVGLGSSGTSVEGQVVAGIATTNFWLGSLGLGANYTNFSEDERPSSLLRTLKDSNLIPSLSYGYTAGAPYRYSKVVGSLTLGGYDSSRFTDNSISFPFGSDSERPLVVGLQSAIGTDTPNGTVSLSGVGSGVLAVIDSTVPDLWLPEAWCDLFEGAFGLSYVEETGRYLVDAEQHAELQQLQPTLTFTLGASTAGGTISRFDLPYAAFDLEGQYPVFSNTTRYFPIRRAANDSQYTIGRVFLQETYLTVDSERGVFNVSQAKFTNPMPSADLVAIISPSDAANSTASGNSTTSVASQDDENGLGGGTIAGIVVGAVGAVLILAGCLFWWLRRRRSPHRKWPDAEPAESRAEDAGPPQYGGELVGSAANVPELSEGKARTETATPKSRHEAASATPLSEAEGREKYEAEGSAPFSEAGGTERYEAEGSTPMFEAAVGPDNFCAFTQPSFNGNRGIAVVTTAEILEKVVSLPIFTVPGSQQAVLDQSTSLAYRDEQIPGKGIGLIAARALQINEAFLTRMPIIMVDDTAFKRLGRARLTELLAQGIGDLPQAHQAEYLNLTTHGEVKTDDEKVYEIFMKNDFVTPVDEIIEFHSVFPQVFAARKIQAGEELTVTYFDEEAIKESDDRVEQIQKLQKDLDDYSPASSATPEKAELLIRLFEAEGLFTRIVEAYYRAAVEWNGVGSAEKAVKFARLCIEEGKVLESSIRPFMNNMRGLARDPSAHWTWRFRSNHNLK